MRERAMFVRGSLYSRGQSRVSQVTLQSPLIVHLAFNLSGVLLRFSPCLGETHCQRVSWRNDPVICKRNRFTCLFNIVQKGAPTCAAEQLVLDTLPTMGDNRSQVAWRRRACLVLPETVKDLSSDPKSGPRILLPSRQF